MFTLKTNLNHIESKEQLQKILEEHENVMVCCGRMGPMCIPVYSAMESFERSGKYNHVKFYDMLFDLPDASVIRSLPECRGFMSLPFTVYYKNGKVVKATAGLQTPEQIEEILEEYF